MWGIRSIDDKNAVAYDGAADVVKARIFLTATGTDSVRVEFPTAAAFNSDLSGGMAAGIGYVRGVERAQQLHVKRLADAIQAPGMSTIRRATMTGALRAAADMYERDAREIRSLHSFVDNPGLQSLASQFDRQAAEAQGIAEQIEQAGTVTLHD